MPITINTNVAAMSAQRNLEGASMRSQSSLSKLSSGSRVPSAKEDAASLAVGTGLKLDVTALRAAQTNAAQGSSLLQIADGAFGEISNILDRMKSLSTTAQSAQLSSTERGYLNDEFTSLRSEIDRIAGATEFNGIGLLGGKTDVVANGAAATGLVGVELDSSVVNAGDTFEVEYTAATRTVTIANSTTGASESAVLPTVTAGTTEELDFSALGVSITVDSSFDGTGLSGLGATEFTAQQGTSVSQQADLDFQVGINAGDTINVKVDQGDYTSLVNGPSQLEPTTASLATATALVSTAGFVGFEIDGNLRNAGEFIAISYDDTNEELTVSVLDGTAANLGSSTNVIASQTIDASALDGGITGAAIETVNFDQLGVSLQLSSAFAPAADIANAATSEIQLGAVGGAQVTADISSVANAQKATEQVSAASVSVNTARANLGSSLNRLEFAQSNLAVSIENTEAARSTLMDVDVSAEMTKFTSEQVLIQAGVSMLAQANQQPSLLLRLLQ